MVFEEVFGMREGVFSGFPGLMPGLGTAHWLFVYTLGPSPQPCNSG